MYGRHDRYSKIDLASSDAHAEPAVLGNTPFGYVQLGHHLDSLNYGLVVRDVDWVCCPVQRAVNSVLDHHVGVARLDMDIRSPALQRIEYNGVDQLDDGRHLLIAGQPVYVQVFFAVLGFDQKRKLVGPEPRRRILEYPGGRVAALEDLFDGRPGCDCDFDPHSNLGTYFVQRIQ